ncbi:unnamed protein product [Rotaria sp. Silwood1]|nr:unnamed protein product [Rotaria sp. Silwood1]
MGAAAGLFAKLWSPEEIKTRFSDIGKGTIEVEKGDITAQKVDVIIGTSSSVNLKNAILDAAGTAARTAYNAELRKNPQPILISIPSGGLPCKKIFLIKWRPEQDEAKLRKSIADFISNAIKYVIEHGFTSVAFPAIGCGDHQCSTNLVITTMLPETWVRSAEGTLRFTVSNTTPEYESVCTMFQQAMKGKCKQVVRIERIQNEQWYIQYIAHSKGFCRKLNKNTERRLYHGCSHDAADSIIKSCFNRSFAGVHGNTKSTVLLTISISCSLSLGTAYGQSVYFSTNAAYSHDYATPKANSERCMFVARVLIGTTIPGNSSMRTQPIGFDSTTDGNHIFVIYHDAQAYGEYLITYK